MTALSFEEKAEDLLSKIIVIKSNPHYRIADVVYRKGFRYQDSADQVLSLPEFNDTILKNYLVESRYSAKPDIPLLSKLVDRAAMAKGYEIPRADDLVIHIRAGDVVEHNWFLKGNFVEEVANFRAIRRCMFVICFAFQEYFERGWWLYSDTKLKENQIKTRDLFIDMMKTYPELDFAVFSNQEIDRDFVYMINANGFIRDQGGFSDLICELRTYRASVEGIANIQGD